MIISIPESKKLKYNKQYKLLNEALFDDIYDDDELDDEIIDSQNAISKELQEIENIAKVEKILYQLDVHNYEIEKTGTGILNVNIHSHLYLSNKNLNRFNFNIFKFNNVDGNVNYSGNKLTNWNLFPKFIQGNLYANFNYLKNFNGAPIIQGDIIATKQYKKTDYPLTKENYLKHRLDVTENSVYALPVNKIGEIYNINENDNSCIIQFKDNTRQKFNLNEVEYLGNIEKLFNL